ncbi:biotin/lipoyl-containing protein [Ferroacidibacillus organovorans]|uniref:Acetyl-CoA carboxylase biotin carboxyl carrier protein subunit n=1 Tax=Ferroacidibacillus organovorans TaxID=1765683 RepID=A0A101XQB9_9BACL|nr:biotin/lipoyl-containing protein [Ferroacidibacillus organovorans]KUO95546.1 acetyl-CoA carboxylase biotin carboxyl carrier protein subunit [Ferroacidibacillus organovorans]
MQAFTAEMAGTLYQVLVTVGQTVSAGEDLYILESMKMEVPFSSPVAGRVVTIHKNPGDFVNEGDPIVTLEPLR